MTLNFLSTSNAYTCRFKLLTILNGILFSYLLLTSICIKAGPDAPIDQIARLELHNTFLNLGSDKDKWSLVFMPNNTARWHKKGICYMAIIDTAITSSESIRQQICPHLTTILQDNNIEDTTNVSDPRCFTPYYTDNLLADRQHTHSDRSLSNPDMDVDMDSDIDMIDLNLGVDLASSLEKESYTSALVVIAALNDATNEVNFKLERIDFKNIAYDEALIINDFSKALDIVRPLFASCSHLKHASKNIPQINNADCNNMSGKKRPRLDDESDSYDNLHPKIPLPYTHEDVYIEPENTFTPDILAYEPPDHTTHQRKKRRHFNTASKNISQPDNIDCDKMPHKKRPLFDEESNSSDSMHPKINPPYIYADFYIESENTFTSYEQSGNTTNQRKKRRH
ncbi:MAG: hypothetical protein QS748_14240 [Candidatus Endonucleobacter bathymodioli]|uniref:Uncharacterized protein n=1 Tax=Candidatus Endonucleibacter bathymodioli TaxID=539814 RepID=A0AA90P381_9GAMM|nr:hypothetical protein [Candidatus Endonucleobacter bathymodioli]